MAAAVRCPGLVVSCVPSPWWPHTLFSLAYLLPGENGPQEISVLHCCTGGRMQPGRPGGAAGQRRAPCSRPRQGGLLGPVSRESPSWPRLPASALDCLCGWFRSVPSTRGPRSWEKFCWVEAWGWVPPGGGLRLAQYVPAPECAVPHRCWWVARGHVPKRTLIALHSAGFLRGLCVLCERGLEGPVAPDPGTLGGGVESFTLQGVQHRGPIPESDLPSFYEG